MHPKAVQLVRNIARAVEHAPEVADRIERVTNSYDRAARALRRNAPAPAATPLHELDDLEIMGALTCIVYGADKGNGLEQFVHDFEKNRRRNEPLPLLCHTRGRGLRDLVIVRDGSRYSVNADGYITG